MASPCNIIFGVHHKGGFFPDMLILRCRRTPASVGISRSYNGVLDLNEAIPQAFDGIIRACIWHILLCPWLTPPGRRFLKLLIVTKAVMLTIPGEIKSDLRFPGLLLNLRRGWQ